ncbi:MAG: NAD(P)/FAD-dependent oxidoreductase, partial [Candidatus Geothermincolia bacterium]
VMPGRKVVILGSGDIGMIMARRICLEGGEVEGVYEIMDHAGGITRNRVQCLDNYDIPLHLQHTVTFIHGRKRVEGVSVAAVGNDWKPIPDSGRFIPCDLLMLSVGLIPENELSRKAGLELDATTGGPVVDETMQTSIAGVFACGNVVSVYDLVDYVSQTAETAGRGAAAFVLEGRRPQPTVRVIPGKNVKYVVPQLVTSLDEEVFFYFRVEHPERAVAACLSADGEEISRRKARMVRPPEMMRLKARRTDRLIQPLREVVLDVVGTEGCAVSGDAVGEPGGKDGGEGS